MVIASGAASVAVVACGGDDTNGGGADSGRDGTTDTSTDGLTPPPDTGTDAATDSGTDASDASDSGPLPDVHPSPVDQFPGQVTEAYCESISRCCTSAFGREAGTFDLSRCINTQNNGGGFKDLALHAAALAGDAGALVKFDLAKAGKCLQDIATFTCPPPPQTAIEYQTARDDCYAALQGTITLGGTGCTDSIHCATGRCVGGTCVALAGDGGACQTSDDCAYRGTSTPNSFCNADGTLDATTCVPRLDIDGSCGNYNDFDYAACTSGLCDFGTGLCSASAPFIDPGTCDVFTLKDAGAD